MIKVSLTIYTVTLLSFGIILDQRKPLMSVIFLISGIDSAIMYSLQYEKAFKVQAGVQKLKLSLRSMIKQGPTLMNQTEYRQLVQSVPNMRIRVGDFQYFNRTSIVNFLGFVVRAVVRVLIVAN